MTALRLSKLPFLPLILSGFAATCAYAADLIRTEDIVFSISADSDSYAGNIQCNGQVTKRAGLTFMIGDNGSGTQEIKYAVAPDPKDAAKNAFYFSTRATDPDTAGDGNKRCEHSYSTPATWLPWGQDFWFAVRLGTAHFDASSDQQVIWQWHEGSNTAGLSPHLAAIVQGGTLKIMAIANYNSVLTQANSTKWVLYQAPWKPGMWNRFVVKARIHPTNGLVKVWHDGALVADYAGPFGFGGESYTASHDYVKVGVYHWTGAGNTWDPNVPLRQAWVSETLLARDNPAYTFQTFDDYLKAKYPNP